MFVGAVCSLYEQTGKVSGRKNALLCYGYAMLSGIPCVLVHVLLAGACLKGRGIHIYHTAIYMVDKI